MIYALSDLHHRIWDYLNVIFWKPVIATWEKRWWGRGRDLNGTTKTSISCRSLDLLFDWGMYGVFPICAKSMVVVRWQFSKLNGTRMGPQPRKAAAHVQSVRDRIQSQTLQLRYYYSWGFLSPLKWISPRRMWYRTRTGCSPSSFSSLGCPWPPSHWWRCTRWSAAGWKVEGVYPQSLSPAPASLSK